MKHFLTIVFAALIVLNTSCKKDDETEPAVEGNWTLGTATYDVAFSAKTSTSGGDVLIIFADGVPQGSNPQINTFNLSFKTQPTAGGTYELISAGTTKTTDKQVHIAAGGPAGVYTYLDTPMNITIEMKDGKVSLVLPEITVKSTGSANTGLKLSASLAEM